MSDITGPTDDLPDTAHEKAEKADILKYKKEALALELLELQSDWLSFLLQIEYFKTIISKV